MAYRNRIIQADSITGFEIGYEISKALEKGDILMNSSALAYGRKLFSIALIFNALVCIVYTTGLLSGFYTANWQLYPPYSLDGNFFWIVIAASILNIFPAAFIGQVKTGRLWFHHYVYGFIVLSLSVAFLVFFTPVSLLDLFTANITDVTVNIGRFFVLGGIALILDDLPDVANWMASFITNLKAFAHKSRKVLQAINGVLGAVCLYFAVAICVSMAQNPTWTTVANFIFVGTLIITSITSFWSVKRKVWYKIAP